MKKLFIIGLCSLALSSCITIGPILTQTSSTVDFSKYQKNGMFLTEATSVSFSYEPVANVSAVQMSGYRPLEGKAKVFVDDAYGDNSDGHIKLSKEFVNASKADVLEELCRKAKEIGANGVINIKFTYLNIPYGKSYRTGYEVNGMAIKK